MNLPRLGFSFPASTLSAVDFPIPFVPTSPKTCPGFGIGNLCNLNAFGPYRCVVSFSKSLGRLMIWIASNGNFLTQITQPMHNSSDINAILEAKKNSMQRFLAQRIIQNP